MTGRSNSATTSRKMWMLSASSARRWSSRKSVVTSGDKATVDIHVNHEGTKRSKATKTNVFLRELRSASDLEENRGVLADRVEHDRPFELGHHLAEDVDALGFQRAEMVES